MQKTRYDYSSEEKVMILKRHLLDREKVSDLCDEYRSYSRKSFTVGKSNFLKIEPLSFPLKRKTPKKVASSRIQQLEEKLCRKYEVLSEFLKEHILLKKLLGDP